MKKLGHPLKKTERIYTYADYKTWPDDERWELIHGTAWNMSPAPSRTHQWIVTELCILLGNYLAGKDCELYVAPFGVFLPALDDVKDDDIDTIVQPDLVVICDSGKLAKRGCFGPPDIVVEILSPFTSKKDLNEKFELYEAVGVREYLIFDPGARSAQVFSIGQSGKFDKGTLSVDGDIAESQTLIGLTIDTDELFGNMPAQLPDYIVSLGYRHRFFSLKHFL